MIKNLLILALFFISLNSYSQTKEDLKSLFETYQKLIDNYNQERNAEIKELSPSNYISKKTEINSKYDALIDDVRKERKAKADILIVKIEENSKKLKERREQEELEKISVAKKEIEQKKLRLEKKRQEREDFRIQEEKREIYEGSDLGEIIKKTKFQFKAWLLQSEMETNEEYTKRVKEKSNGEFKKFLDKNIKISKENAFGIASACLQNYNIENEEFLIGVKKSEYRERQDTVSKYVYIPKKIAPEMKSKYGCANKTIRGKPMLLHVLDCTMYEDNWIASKIIFIFPNGYTPYSGKYNKPFYDAEYWNKTNIIEKRGKYYLGYAFNIGRDPVKLKNIEDSFKNEVLKDKNYYFEWNLDSSYKNPIELNLEDLNINIPNTNK